MEKVEEFTSKILHKQPGFRTRDTGANTCQLITKADHTDSSISLVRDSRGNVTPSISNLKLDSSELNIFLEMVFLLQMFWQIIMIRLKLYQKKQKQVIKKL